LSFSQAKHYTSPANPFDGLLLLHRVIQIFVALTLRNEKPQQKTAPPFGKIYGGPAPLSQSSVATLE
jgi:hypothetical protein